MDSLDTIVLDRLPATVVQWRLKLMSDLKIPGTLDFDKLLERRHTASESIKRMQAVVAECNVMLDAVLSLNETEKLQTNEFVVFRRKGSAPRKTLVPEKLLAKGVPASVIQECTVVGEGGRPSIVVKRAGHDDED